MFQTMIIMERFRHWVELKYLRTPYLLRLVDLSSNKFEGEIPTGIIGKLRGLHLLNLSNNTFNGSIPSTLVQLNFLEYFNVSHNHLWGPIPLGQQFNTFQEDSYQGNSGLCGKPLSKKCKDSKSLTPSPPSVFEEDEDPKVPFKFDWYVVLPGVFCGLIVGFVAGNAFAEKKHEWFVETFSKRTRQPRAKKGSRGQRT
ncbi:receptor-like protein 12 [Pyrus ussuriensis x Pyrus communis]|uniref:Receptor-like protein 12 n=1 Tax=Pyrus ussuriensis x Pyrus communis TaxID=2448454 RepID=A0A5N5FX20_9ROSA|nr:receptor-like protein 12 [Pyrus ussuriensis x Pyrus communis]